MNFRLEVLASRRFALSRHIRVGAALILGCSTSSTASAAITYTPFGPNGEGGTVNAQLLSFGSGGEIYELDGFFAVAGQDLNGLSFGTAAQLSRNPLPAGLDYSFTPTLSLGGSDLTLSYTFVNNTGSALAGVWFGSFVDPQIDDVLNGYQDEAGIQFGAVGSGASDADPDQWQIDEPGYVSGTIFTNLLQATLDDTNSIPEGAPNDVSVALSFTLADLPNGATAVFTMLLSDSGDSLGTLAVQTYDTSPQSLDVLTVSGSAQIIAVPEPSGLSLLLSACGVGATLVSISYLLPRRRQLAASDR